MWDQEAPEVTFLAVELQGFGLNKPEAAKFSRTLVETYGVGSWSDVMELKMKVDFEKSFKVAILRPVSIMKFNDVRHRFFSNFF